MLIYTYSYYRNQSQSANAERLKKLRVKIDCIDQVVEESKKVLLEKLKSKPEDYKNVLKKLLIQVSQ